MSQQLYPFFTTINFFIGSMVSAVIILGIWKSNTWFTAYLPIQNPDTFDHFGQKYNVSRILDSHGRLDEKKLSEYSYPYMAASQVQLYMFSFAEYSAIIFYAAIIQGKTIWHGMKATWTNLRIPYLKEGLDDSGQLYADVHYRLMKNYKEGKCFQFLYTLSIAPLFLTNKLDLSVNNFWYLLILIASLGIGLYGLAAFPTETPLWVVVYGILMAAIFLVPTGIMLAMTGTTVTTNVIAEFIGGCIVPGNALAMNYFKTYGLMTLIQAFAFSSELKLGHYTKVHGTDF